MSKEPSMITQLIYNKGEDLADRLSLGHETGSQLGSPGQTPKKPEQLRGPYQRKSEYVLVRAKQSNQEPNRQ
jgi:hypothetical protein